ncbi:CAP domain-containing protein [Lentinula aff. lateritia]|uniref:CAP domain-containing protein n=1 Tax=Lentinula aff. lateritia TaxID=2804960 RepID=A0ACC1TSD5_9AGAR|nr:CAP domain-containing protein [Lentinula aff. lateritia]
MSTPSTRLTISTTFASSSSASSIATISRPTSTTGTNSFQTPTKLSSSSTATSSLINFGFRRTSSVQTPTRFVTSSALTSSLTSSSQTASATSGATTEFIQSTLNSHNTARAQYGASSLTWSSNLYPAAQQWANACVFQHRYAGGNYGENLAAAAPHGISVQQGVDMWMAEACAYSNQYSNPTFSSSTGHFTQVVWKSTISVACAIATCNFLGNGTGYSVCRYDPPGNYLGQFA